LGRIWAEDVTLTAADGQVVTSRSAALATVNPANMAGLKAVSDDVRIRLYGDVAVVTGRVNITGQRDGASINGHFRYTDVFVRRGSNWQLVADQMTKVVSER
jgi:ketosteroid isomerase-like protein